MTLSSHTPRHMPRRMCAKEERSFAEKENDPKTLDYLRACQEYLLACHPEKTKAIGVLAQLVKELPKNGFTNNGEITVKSLEELENALEEAIAAMHQRTELPQKTRHVFCCRIEAVLARYI